MIPGIIKVSDSVISLSLRLDLKVEVSVISRSRRLRLITLSETLIIPDITKTESNCFIMHCFEENNDKRIIAAITVYFQTHCSWKSCIAHATYRLFTYLYRYRLVNNL